MRRSPSSQATGTCATTRPSVLRKREDTAAATAERSERSEGTGCTVRNHSSAILHRARRNSTSLRRACSTESPGQTPGRSWTRRSCYRVPEGCVEVGGPAAADSAATAERSERVERSEGTGCTVRNHSSAILHRARRNSTSLRRACSTESPGQTPGRSWTRRSCYRVPEGCVEVGGPAAADSAEAQDRTNSHDMSMGKRVGRVDSGLARCRTRCSTKRYKLKRMFRVAGSRPAVDSVSIRRSLRRVAASTEVSTTAGMPTESRRTEKRSSCRLACRTTRLYCLTSATRRGCSGTTK